MEVFSDGTYIFMDNSPQDSVIALVHTSGSSNFTTYVNRNKFKNNTAVVLSTNVPYVAIHENFFENDNFYNIRVTATNNSYKHDVINASFNDWGTSDVTAIARSIYDNVYDEKLPRVIFHPYLESKDTSHNEHSSFVSPSRELGGAVNGNVTLTAEDGPFLVTANIKVQPDDALTLKEGVVLKFKTNTGLVANGN